MKNAVFGALRRLFPFGYHEGLATDGPERGVRPPWIAMVTEIHCPCGAHQPVLPEKVKKAIRCPKCGQNLTFLGSGNGQPQIVWLTIGGVSGPPRLAVPVPTGMKLTIGAAADCWLALPGEGVDEKQAELKLAEDARLTVRHIGADGRTWINKSRIHSGVLQAGDTLRIGPYHMRLRGPEELAALAAEAAAEIVVEEEADDEPPPPRKRKEREDVFSDEAIESGWSTGQKLRAGVSLLLILAAGGYLAKTYLLSAAGSDMPDDTEYRCPIDGTKFRAPWKEGSAYCPQCGQLCLGAMRYKPESMGGFAPGPTSQPGGTPPAVIQPTSRAATTKPAATRPATTRKKKPRAGT